MVKPSPIFIVALWVSMLTVLNWPILIVRPWSRASRVVKKLWRPPASQEWQLVSSRETHSLDQIGICCREEGTCRGGGADAGPPLRYLLEARAIGEHQNRIWVSFKFGRTLVEGSAEVYNSGSGGGNLGEQEKEQDSQEQQFHLRWW